MTKVENTKTTYLTVEETAERLGIHHQKVHSLITEGTLKETMCLGERDSVTLSLPSQPRISIKDLEDYEANLEASKKESEKHSDYLTLEEASEIHGTAVGNLYASIKRKTLNCYTDPLTKQHKISREELERYMKAKTSTAHRRFNGELVCDKNKGEHSFVEAAEILGLTYQDLFYEIKSPTCSIKYIQKGKYKVFYIDDIKAYEKLLKAKKSK